MKRLDIQFANRATSAGWLKRLALAAGIVGLAASLWTHVVARLELQRVSKDLAEVGAALTQRQAAAGARPPESIPATQIYAINTAIAQLNLPWTELFAALEAAQSPAIALVALEPDAKKRSVVVQAEAKTSQQMIAFAERLKQTPLFEEAILAKHEIREQDPNRPYRFTVELRWREGV